MKTYDPYTLDPRVAEKLAHIPVREMALRAGAKRAHLEQIVSVLGHNRPDDRESALAELKRNRREFFFK